MSKEKEHRCCELEVMAVMPNLSKAHIYCNDHKVAFIAQYEEIVNDESVV